MPPALAWVLWLAWKSGVSISPARRWFSASLRTFVTVAIILALSGVEWMSAIQGMNVFYLLDRSDSIAPRDREAAAEWINKTTSRKESRDRAGLVAFGADASIESLPGIDLDARRLQTVVTPDHTDIGAAIRLAAAAFPEFGQRRITLVSDGNENEGDALSAAALARGLGVSVDVAPIGSAEKTDVYLERLDLPSNVAKGQTFQVKAFVHADKAGPGTVRLYRNEQYIGEKAVQLDAGKNLLEFSQTLPDAGFYTYDLRLDAAFDAVPQNNRAFGFTRVKGTPQVLLISSDAGADAPLARALQSSDLNLVVKGTSAFPGSLAELQSYDSILLCNVASGDITRDQQRMLETAVRDFGAGVVCVGGDQTYAAGAYRGTPLADILPVNVELSSKKVLPPGALALVIDQSGSMTGDKLDMARQSAAGAVNALGPNDYVAVIAFDTSPHVVVEMRQARDRKKIIDEIMGIGAGGGTVMYPAMERAQEMLRGVKASFKHCIILTDGISAPGNFEALTHSMASDRITVSTVGIGPEIDAGLLQNIANAAHGRFYPVPSPELLPQIFIKETAVVLKSAIDEEPFAPKLVAGTEPVRGFSPGEFPPLLGYVVTEARPRAETPMVTSKGDPLLAHWQYGLGRVVAFTSDARAKWGKDWLTWPKYQQFWRQTVQWSLRRLENADLTPEITMDRGKARLTVEALDAQGNFRNFLNLDARVAGPGGTTRELRLAQTGPGRYEASFPALESGAYLCNLLQTENGKVAASQLIGASLNYSPELLASAPNLNLLRRIADITGGKVLDPDSPASNPFLHDRGETRQPHDLWQWLLRVAIIFFVLDVAVRRVQPDWEEWGKLWQRVLKFPRLRRDSAAEEAKPASLDALLARRNQVSAEHAQRSTFQKTPSMPEAMPPLAYEPDVLVSTTHEEAPAVRPVEEPRSTTNRLLEAKRRAQKRL
ncbi:MAG TPA: VWA domain-containing protein [Verrucomicrobiae bacterium]|nr:VWA domain-containing protein [Verrucomicrobiae bacterium]